MQELPYQEVKEKIDYADSVTILSHLNPDADTLGTALGIYALLSKDKSKRVEVVNASNTLPVYLDFLPGFHKIKSRMKYMSSLIITCDGGSIDRFGFDLEGRDIINIDHHQSNTYYGKINVVVADDASASQVAYRVFKEIFEIEADAATCFYTALFSDTRYFTTNSVNKEVFSIATSLVEAGAKPDTIAYNLTQRRSLASVRILQKALHSLSFSNDAQIATLSVSRSDIIASGARMVDMEDIVEYARSLATVEIAVFAMELEEGVRISLRSKEVDVSKVASAFGGGGHKVAAGFTLKQGGVQESIDTILEKIRVLNLLAKSKVR
ncbi:MAG: DHH family phosphoesterase [Campylobacterota bacterium]|nr:DHH family phosphoesterase [Campylobacterota bacterium]